jgi:hypothetical protein
LTFGEAFAFKAMGKQAGHFKNSVT